MEYTHLITVNVIPKDVLASAWGRCLSKGTGYFFVFGFCSKLVLIFTSNIVLVYWRYFAMKKYIYLEEMWDNTVS